MPSVWAVVVAGGSGERFGRMKQFALLGGRPVVARAVAACRSVARGVVLVVPKGATDEDYGADAVVVGGATRSASVREGLAAVPGDADVVVVHDAVRPLAPPALFAAVLAALADGEAAGAVPALPVADTLKRVAPLLTERAGPPWPVVQATVDRGDLVAVQTPQAFVAEVLRRAHAGGPEATDDAALLEALGATVRVVPGDPRNLKLTTPADLARAEQLLGP
ncbi:MAG TPA: 2-C-methyl-D-erythritol 4-phosphate cytidylyltransferase [Acidimicrobiales bacterium]|nr:2-C-methyl-D-erythritol 4-phosphate cytidylyltransferase [Acidimicrobiales bacterium]